MIREWQNRPLEATYAIVMLDAIHYEVREDGAVVKKAVYIAIGTDLEGKKGVLGLWIGATESAKYWLGMLNGPKSCGVQDILIVSVDGLTGFFEAISAAYLNTEIQRCVVHQIRSSTRYVSYKDVKAFAVALKPICKTPTEEAGLETLNELEQAWGTKYPASIQFWRNHWDELATMFKYPEQIHRIIYTTNAIENFNRQLRKVTKTKAAFASDDALLKQLYQVTAQTTDKWTMPIKDWGSILMQLMVYFGDRVNVAL